MNAWLGWAATAVFAASYFVRNPSRMRLVQACASILWILYGVVLQATPIIVANIIVAGLAVFSAVREASATKATAVESAEM
jgi:inner membrane protein